MSRDHIRTDFMDKQAKENAREGTGRGVLVVIGLLLLVGIGFGGFKVYEHMSRFDFFTLKRNTQITLNSPTVKDGKAVVTVDIANFNACDVSNPVFTYTIESRDEKPVGSGQVEINGTIPAADKRSFRNVELGPVNGQPARMHTDLVNLTGTLDKNLPKGFAARFGGAFDDPGTVVESLKKLEAEAPNFDNTHVALGLAYESQNDWKNALEEYSRAVTCNPTNANAQYHYGLALAHENDPVAADKVLRRAKYLAPSDSVIDDAIARVRDEIKRIRSLPSPGPVGD